MLSESFCTVVFPVWLPSSEFRNFIIDVQSPMCESCTDSSLILRAPRWSITNESLFLSSQANEHWKQKWHMRLTTRCSRNLITSSTHWLKRKENCYWRCYRTSRDTIPGWSLERFSQIVKKLSSWSSVHTTLISKQIALKSCFRLLSELNNQRCAGILSCAHETILCVSTESWNRIVKSRL